MAIIILVQVITLFNDMYSSDINVLNIVVVKQLMFSILCGIYKTKYICEIQENKSEKKRNLCILLKKLSGNIVNTTYIFYKLEYDEAH